MEPRVSEFIIPLQVRSCVQRSRIASAKKSLSGEVELQHEDLGWFLTLDPIGISIRLANADEENPGFQTGDSIDLIIRKRKA